jgi:hypothetical protein
MQERLHPHNQRSSPARRSISRRPLTHAACKKWRAYLRGATDTVGQFTQHLFIVFGDTVEIHKILGGQLHSKQGLVVSRTGPLLIVGILTRDNLNARDRRIWEVSSLQRRGGEITPIQEWHVGKNITMPLTQILWVEQLMVAARAKQIIERKN